MYAVIVTHLPDMSEDFYLHIPSKGEAQRIFNTRRIEAEALDHSAIITMQEWPHGDFMRVYIIPGQPTRLIRTIKAR